MSSVKAEQTLAPIQATGNGKSRRTRLHHVVDYRVGQGLSQQQAARLLQIELAQIRDLEHPNFDMHLSTLYRWHQALGVPITDLVVERDDPMSPPLEKKARLVDVMRMARTMQHTATHEPLRRLATTLIDQLTQLLPELAQVQRSSEPHFATAPRIYRADVEGDRGETPRK